jgi:hypothetical protein
MVKSLFSAAALLLGTLPAPAENPPATAPAPSRPATPSSKPADAPKPDAPPAPAIKSLGGPRYELNGITFNGDTRAITLPATVNMTEGLLEYALVHESGKVHESLLSTPISPYDLNVVLLLLNYQPSATFFDTSDQAAGAVLVRNPKIEAQAKLLVTLEWKDPAGKAQKALLESLLLNIDQKAPAKDGPFVYTGSMLMEDGTFMAKETGSILALYADASALLNNPRQGNENDDNWLADKSKVPPKGTTVTVTLTPAPK